MKITLFQRIERGRTFSDLSMALSLPFPSNQSDKLEKMVKDGATLQYIITLWSPGDSINDQWHQLDSFKQRVIFNFAAPNCWNRIRKQLWAPATKQKARSFQILPTRARFCVSQSLLASQLVSPLVSLIVQQKKARRVRPSTNIARVRRRETRHSFVRTYPYRVTAGTSSHHRRTDRGRTHGAAAAKYHGNEGNAESRTRLSVRKKRQERALADRFN